MKRYSTEQRLSIEKYLADNHDEYLTAARIAAALESTGVSRSSVYRNLAEMARRGLVDRSIGDSGEVLYRFCGERCSKSIHLMCERCGRLIHLGEGQTVAIEGAVASTSGFRMDAARTVIYGVCEDCR